MIGYRNHLKNIPELYFREIKTSEYIDEKLTSFGLEVHKNIAKTGLVGILKSNNENPERNIAIRAEMDALPMENGNRHACGHDGHMAIVLGIAEYFSKNRNSFGGIIYFIFSPAEEDGAGCNEMLKNDFFNSLGIQEAYALHNWPDLKVGQIGISEGVIMAGDDNFCIRIIGRGGHGAMPEHAINPNNYIGRIIKKLKEIANRNKVILTPTGINGGTAFNVIPDLVTIKGTFRYLTKETKEKVLLELKNIKIEGVVIETQIIDGYIPTINNKECAKYCKKVVRDMIGTELIKITRPSMATEDFSYLLEKIKGCYVWLGTGDPEHLHKLHSNNFDFNDKVLDIGFNYFRNLVLNRLPIKSFKNQPIFKNNLIFLGFIQLATDYTLDMEISGVLNQIDGIGWRIKKLPFIGGFTDINKSTFKKLKDELKNSATGFGEDTKYGKLSLVSLACTSMSFILGREIIDQELRKGYNVPTNDTTTSILAVMNKISIVLKLKNINISLLTPYIDKIHDKYRRLMKHVGCNIMVERNLNLQNDSLTSSVTNESIEKIIDEMITINSDIHIFIIVCSALNVTNYGFIDKMEKKHSIYFITSNQALLWNSLNLALPDGKKDLIKNVKGYGRVFQL